MSELLSPDVLRHAVPTEPLPADEVTGGQPQAGAVPLATLGATEVGIWEMSEGSARDTEVDEVFVVLAGAGTVTFADGRVVDLGPGVAVRLSPGDRTQWVVTERLRKLYVA